MTLIDYIYNGNNKYNGLEINTKIGNVEIPCSMLCNDVKFTDACIEQYGDILNAKIKVIKEDINSLNNSCYSTIEILGDINIELVSEFIYAMAGYIDTDLFLAYFDYNH